MEQYLDDDEQRSCQSCGREIYGGDWDYCDACITPGYVNFNESIDRKHISHGDYMAMEDAIEDDYSEDSNPDSAYMDWEWWE